MRRTVLDNGIRVVTEGVPGARSMSVGVWLGVGSRDEPAARAGLCHLLEHLVFKGTKNRDARSLSLAFDAVGGEVNAYTTKERTAYYSRVPADRHDVGVDLLLEIFTSPALRSADLASEREVILEELAGAEDDPGDLADTKLFEAVFADHPLGREVIGSVETVAAITRADVSRFVRRAHRADNIVLAAAGAVDHGRLVEAAAEHLGHFTSGPRLRRRPPAPTDDVMVRSHVRRRTEQTQIALGWRVPGVYDKDRFALAVLEHVLGDGPASRLFWEVRERRGLVYAVGSALSLYDDCGVLSVSTATAPERADEVTGLILSEVARTARDGITPDELDAAKGFVVGSTLVGLEDSSTCMARLGYLELTYGEVIPVELYLAQMTVVTLDDVALVAADLVAHPPALATVVLGPCTSDTAVLTRWFTGPVRG